MKSEFSGTDLIEDWGWSEIKLNEINCQTCLDHIFIKHVLYLALNVV